MNRKTPTGYQYRRIGPSKLAAILDVAGWRWKGGQVAITYRVQSTQSA